MNVIGLCQGANLEIFTEVLALTSDHLTYDRVGVFVADAAHARRSSATAKLAGAFEICWLREWESVRAGLATPADMDLVARFGDLVGSPSLWSAVLADRRLIFGRYCKSIQAYKPRFSHEQLLGILSEAIRRIQQLFDTVKPDLVFGFVPVTLHEYLILRMATAQGVPVRLLRSTKIQNYVSLNDRLFGASEHINSMLDGIEEPDEKCFAVADRYMQATATAGAAYEGMHLPAHALRRFNAAAAARALLGAARNEWRRLGDEAVRTDSHNPGYLVPAVLEQFVQPLRAASARRLISVSNNRGHKFVQTNYCLFPLHFEPEIALQIYGRPLQNQIEVARSIALALPVGMTLVVKEHPRAAGFRPKRYYEKLLEIPNVVIAEPERPSRDLVSGARVVTVITGNIGLEALVLGKPVIVLGEAEYAVLPRHILRTCHNLYELSGEIADLLGHYRQDDDAVRRYIASLVSGAVPVDLYSTLLGKSGRHSTSGKSFREDITRLRDYALTRLTTTDDARQ
jgi:hypothetical protein